MACIVEHRPDNSESEYISFMCTSDTVADDVGIQLASLYVD